MSKWDVGGVVVLVWYRCCLCGGVDLAVVWGGVVVVDLCGGWGSILVMSLRVL